MARAAESGAYLGGISTMLAQVDVCPSCGRIHPDSRLGSLLPKSKECPLVVFGSMPTMTEPRKERGGPRPLSVEILAESAPVVPPLPQPSSLSARKPTGLTVPWPMPSHLEDFL
ncbi:MAG TPA: hypothetical protein VFG07_06805 [Thermoplasmata archaeon]|nr:hypothetical protein [Thermoplasmata archaeon]